MSLRPSDQYSKRSGMPASPSNPPRAEFLSQTEFFLRDALARWILGDDPFVARLNPDLPSYGDYDQLMRLDEWQARGELNDSGAEDAA